MLIGISGKKQSGKDTICKIIQGLDIFHNTRYQPVPGKDIDGKVEFVKAYMEELDKHEHALVLPIELISVWKKHAYADKLKQCVATILDVDVKSLEDNEFKNSKIPWITWAKECYEADGVFFTHVSYTVREFLQLLGTEVGRHIDSKIWINALFNSYDEEICDWIIPDVRMVNEADEIKKRGGILIRVERVSNDKDAHSSETSLDNYREFDFVIKNNSSLDNLIEEVDRLLVDII